jgi:hypothetical protein
LRQKQSFEFRLKNQRSLFVSRTAQLSIKNLELPFGGHLYVTNDLPETCKQKVVQDSALVSPFQDPAIDGADLSKLSMLADVDQAMSHWPL